MQIYGPAAVHGAQGISAPHVHRTSATSPSGGGSQVSDQLDLSPSATFVDQARNLPDVRLDRVQQLRAAIAEGSYETDQKLNAALDRLLDEIA